MVTEIDCLMAGFVGGFVAAMSVVGVLYFHLRMSVKEYIRGKDDHKLRIHVKKLLEDSETTKI